MNAPVMLSDGSGGIFVNAFFRVASVGALVFLAMPPAGAQTPPDPADPSWIACTRPNGGGLPLPNVVTICNGVIAKGGLAPQHMALAYYYRGNAWINQGNPAMAVPDYTQAATLDPTLTRAFNNRGHAYKQLGNNAEAIADFGRVLVLDPKNQTAWANRGLLLASQGKYSDAVLDFTHAVALDPRDNTAYFNRGFSNYHMGMFGLAVSDYAMALKIDPNDKDAATNLPIARAALQKARAVQSEIDAQREAAERARQARADAESQRAEQEAMQLLGIVMDALVATNAPPVQQAPRPQVSTPSYATPAPQYFPPQQQNTVASQPLGASGPSSKYLNPQTGQPCISIGGVRSEPHYKGLRYIIPFQNTCNRTFSIYAKVIPIGANTIPTRGTGIGPGSPGSPSTSNVSCSSDDGSTSCSGFSSAWAE